MKPIHKITDLNLDDVLREVRGYYIAADCVGVSRAEMARAVGIAQSQMQMWVTGYRNVTKISMLQKLIDGVPRVCELADAEIKRRQVAA